ncbi:MAG: class I SAM-dependent methyltransferase [Actinobacteria bacterium]|nr:class I SAM-dependent methyltransferase [Actinomycetota bacterium]
MLEGKPSRTAQGVAAARASMRRPSSAGGDAAADERLSAELARGIPSPHGLLYQYLVGRTRFFDEATSGAIEDGITQVVIVAAGYDGRALRFRTEGVQFIELDHPATQADKRKLLAELGIDSADVGFAAADFTTDDVGAALAGAGHDPTLATLFLVEGLSVYLDEGVLHGLLTTLHGQAAGGSELAIDLSLVPTTAARKISKASFDRRLASVGEAARTRFSRERGLALLVATGWEPDEVVDAADFNRMARRGSALLVRAEVVSDPPLLS